MNIKNFKQMKLSESNLIKPTESITYDDDFLANNVDQLIHLLEINKLVVAFDKVDKTPIGIFTWKDISKILSSRPWNDILTTWDKVDFVQSEDTVGDCLKKMSKTGFRAFPVLDNGNLLGVLSSQDIRNNMMNRVKITF